MSQCDQIDAQATNPVDALAMKWATQPQSHIQIDNADGVGQVGFEDRGTGMNPRPGL
jgi:hypothetical protein